MLLGEGRRTRLIREDQPELRGVLRVAQHVRHDLQHRRDTRPARYHSHFASFLRDRRTLLVGLHAELAATVIHEQAARAAHVDVVAHFHLLEVLRQLAASRELRVLTCARKRIALLARSLEHNVRFFVILQVATTDYLHSE